MNSSWDQTKPRSQYHFDPQGHDSRWDGVQKLGRFDGSWHSELQQVIASSQPATWATRGYKAQSVAIPSADLAAEQWDLERVGADPEMTITDLNWQIPGQFQHMADLFALKDAMVRIHVQRPGHVWNLHLDKLEKWAPHDPHSVMRITVHLNDWSPGQFWSYGNYQYHGWRAGDVTTFDWINVPHATANAGHEPRVTLQVTGIRTQATHEFCYRLYNCRKYPI